METLGKYRIEEEIGKGGFATVYRAVDTSLEREVALKVLDPLLARDTTWVERFRREARAVAALDHPHIVTIYEIAEESERLFIAMKLIAGRSLDQRLQQQGMFSWVDSLRILEEIGAVLEYAHRKGILHRDLKPGNILLDDQSGAVLTDFGFGTGGGGGRGDSI
jgi:serine/threonine-protein kinase